MVLDTEWERDRRDRASGSRGRGRDNDDNDEKNSGGKKKLVWKRNKQSTSTIFARHVIDIEINFYRIKF